MTSQRPGRGDGRGICGPRGYCGPFVNAEYYELIPDARWSGMAECYHCGRTVHAPTELAKWERSLAAGEPGEGGPLPARRRRDAGPEGEPGGWR